MQCRISTNTNLVAFSREGKRTMLDLIPLYSKAGYRDVDLNFCEMMNPSSALLDSRAEDYIAKLRSFGTGYIQAHAPYNCNEEMILAASEYAASLGVPHIVIHPVKASVRENISYFERLLSLQKNPIMIAIENMEAGDEISSPEDLVEIASALYPSVGICLDTGHANILGYDIPAFIEKTSKYLVGTHIADNNGKRDEHLLPGFGNIDWKSVMHAFKDHYDGFINYECMFFAKNMPQSLSEDIISLSLDIGDWLLSL